MLDKTLCAALLLSTAAWSQVPSRLGYQGRLLNADGSPVAGTVSVTFSLYAQATLGSPLWSETQTLGLSNGYYATQLGDATPPGCTSSCSGVPASVLDGAERFLELIVNGSTLAPRQRVTSVAYAMLAGGVKGPVNATSVAVNGTTVIDSSGALTGPAALRAGPGLTTDGGTLSVQSCAAGQILVATASGWQCGLAPGATHFQLFNASGTFQVPAGITTVWVTASAGGGGGSGGSATNRTGAGGGAGEAVYRQAFTVTPLAMISINVGGGGTAGASGANGGSGGSTTVGALVTLNGGGGGQANAAGGVAGGPGATPGGGSTLAVADHAAGAWGGFNIAGGIGGAGNWTGSDGLRGGGGSGGKGGGSATAGGAGGAGFVMIEY